MLILLVALALQVFPPKPCILIEDHHGEFVPWVEESDGEIFAPRLIEVAVWPDGRIIWSRDGVGKPRTKRLRFFEARIPIPRVRQVLSRFTKANIFQFQKFSRYPFHLGYTKVEVHAGGKSVAWAHMRSSPMFSMSRAEQGEYARAVEAWKLVMREAKALIPDRGKEIPQVRGERAWYSAPPDRDIYLVPAFKKKRSTKRATEKRR